MELTEKELIELKYMHFLGFKYIARHEIGTLCLFKEKPVRNKEANGSNSCGYDTWVIGEYPIKDFSLLGDARLGKYKFITWESGVWEIESLIKGR